MKLYHASKCVIESPIDDMEANKTILQMKYARIVALFAKQVGISLEEALGFFYDSSIYKMMNEGIADMHCRSDGYLESLLQEEWGMMQK